MLQKRILKKILWILKKNIKVKNIKLLEKQVATIDKKLKMLK